MKFYIRKDDKIQLKQLIKACKIMEDYPEIRKEIGKGKAKVNGSVTFSPRYLVKIHDEIVFQEHHIKILSYDEKELIEQEAEGNVKHGKIQSWRPNGLRKDDISTEILRLSKKLHKMLLDRNVKIAFAESCTGGLLQEIVTTNSGATHYFLGGVVSYSDKMKNKILHVPQEVLTEYGAVSSETAKLMEKGIRDICNSDIGVSVTGIAGPSGGTKEKPVGTIFCTIGNNRKQETNQFQFQGNRELVRKQTALNVLKKIITFVRNQF